MSNPRRPAAAEQTLKQKVGVPAFLEKLARDWNIVPQSEAELGQLLHLGDILVAAKASEQVKTASDGNPFLASAIDGLQAALAQEGVATGPNSHEQAVKQAAFELTQDREVAFAALDYADYLTGTE